MKFRFDENLPPRLATSQLEWFQGAVHVRDDGLANASVAAVWAHAMAGGFAIVSKDSHFQQHCFVRGHAPEVVWLRLGDASTADLERFLRVHAAAITAFAADADGALLALA